jgi:hypothetical protein
VRHLHTRGQLTITFFLGSNDSHVSSSIVRQCSRLPPHIPSAYQLFKRSTCACLSVPRPRRVFMTHSGDGHISEEGIMLMFDVTIALPIPNFSLTYNPSSRRSTFTSDFW